MFGITMKVRIGMSIELQRLLLLLLWCWALLLLLLSLLFPSLSLFIHCSIVFILIQWFRVPSTTYTLHTTHSHEPHHVANIPFSHNYMVFIVCRVFVCVCVCISALFRTRLFAVYTYESVKSIWITINNIVHESWTICDAFRISFISDSFVALRITFILHNRRFRNKYKYYALCFISCICSAAHIDIMMWYKCHKIFQRRDMGMAYRQMLAFDLKCLKLNYCLNIRWMMFKQ